MAMEAPGPRSSLNVAVEYARAGHIGMTLQVPAHPVIAVSKPVGKQLVPGIQQEACRFDGTAAYDHQIGGLLLEPAVGIEISHAGSATASVEQDIPDHASG